MRILGIDPGLSCTGLGIYENGAWSAKSIRTKADRNLTRRVRSIALRAMAETYRGEQTLIRGWDLVVIETPQVYEGHKQKGDPNDLIKLSILVGALVQEFKASEVILPLPNTWKGGVDKDVHHRRIREQIPGLGRQSKDAMDGVGLAMYGLDYLRFGGSRHA